MGRFWLKMSSERQKSRPIWYNESHQILKSCQEKSCTFWDLLQLVCWSWLLVSWNVKLMEILKYWHAALLSVVKSFGFMIFMLDALLLLLCHANAEYILHVSKCVSVGPFCVSLRMFASQICWIFKASNVQLRLIFNFASCFIESPPFLGDGRNSWCLRNKLNKLFLT